MENKTQAEKEDEARIARLNHLRLTKPSFVMSGRPFTDDHLEFLKAKGPTFQALWKKRIQKGLTEEMRDIFDLMMEDWKFDQ